MSTQIRLRCPNCHTAVTRENKGFICQNCGSHYNEVHNSDGTVVYDFKQVFQRGSCQCLDRGITHCEFQGIPKIQPSKNVSALSFHDEAHLLTSSNLTGKKILDIGCAEGTYGHLFSRNNTVVGLDECPKRMILDWDNALNKRYNLLIIGDGYNLPFYEEEFDAIILYEILEHLLDVESFIKESYRVLKTGGMLAITVPNLVSLQNRISILIGSGRGFPGDPVGIRFPDQIIHIRWFTPKSLRDFLQSNGFRVTCLTGAGAIPVSSLPLPRILKQVLLMLRIRLFDRVFKGFCRRIMIIAVKE